jgi:hypothetical protein
LSLPVVVGDPVNLASLQLGQKSSWIHGDGANLTARRLLCRTGIFIAMLPVVCKGFYRSKEQAGFSDCLFSR